MCSPRSEQSNALISAQNHGTILVMVAWSFACLLTLCTVSRLITRCKSSRLRQIPLVDDAIIVTASLCSLGSIVIISTAVDSGLGKRRCLLVDAELQPIQLKIYVSTILFVLAMSASKCSILLYVYRIADYTLHRTGVIVVTVLVLLWTIGTLVGIIFQCEMPKPWEIWTGKCIPMLPFWVTTIAVDIVIDVLLVLLSASAVWTIRIEYRQKTLASTLLSLRVILIAASVIRIFYLQRAFAASADPTFDFIPYAITTQCQATIAVMIACTFMCNPLTNVLEAACSPVPRLRVQHSKQWSGTTIGRPYESYDKFGSSLHIIKEPLSSIQASMSPPTSPSSSRYSLSTDILLPDMPYSPKYTKAPPRPPPPREEERPDLSIFRKETCIQKPPMVTRLGSMRKNPTSRPWERLGHDRSLTARGLA